MSKTNKNSPSLNSTEYNKTNKQKNPSYECVICPASQATENRTSFECIDLRSTELSRAQLGK